MRTQMKTQFAGERFAVRADWADAASQIECLDGEGQWSPTRYQVADFRHSPRVSLRRIIEETVIAGGDDPTDYAVEIQNSIDEAEYDNNLRI